MHKILSTLITVFLFSSIYAQNSNEIRGITITGIKGIKQSLAEVIANERAIPADYKVHLRPELEGPKPKGQYPGTKPVSKYGTLINPNDANFRSTSITQTVQSNFLTIWGNYGTAIAGRESPYTPPDNCGDVGTTQIIATANTRMKVFTKPTVTGPASTTPTGTSTTTLSAVVNVDLNVFFTNSSLGINSISDPHVRFDRLSGRWFVVAIDVNHGSGSNYCCVAISDGPTVSSSSNFTKFYFSVAGTGGAANDFFDYPTLGVDKNSLYIGGNMFANGQFFSGSNMWVLNKASLLAGTLTVTSFPHGVTSTDMYTPQGVHNDDPSATNGYFVGASQTFYSKLVIRRVSYAGPTPTLSGDLNLATSTIYTPKTVPTSGGTAIDGGDRRLYAAMIKKNKITGSANLWIAQGTLINISGTGGSGGDRDGALWLEIGNLSATPTILQSSNLWDAVNPTSSAVYYTYPTIAMSGQGHNLIGFTAAGPSRYAQASAAGRYRTDPAGNLSPVDFTNTTSTYNPGANRWGDYTQTVVDPNDDMTMWTFSEYVPTTNAWGVRAAQFKAPPPATPVLSAIPACGSTTAITINGTSVNNSEFFDPGADAGGPGFTRLKVDVSGPGAITISNVVFVNPTQVTASFTVPGNAVSGTYTVTVTNPDGQTATTTFNLNCAPPACGDPTGLSSSSIDNNNETVSWSAVANAVSYDVDYKLPSSGTWTNAATATASTSVNITGLTQGTIYDWRVRANCPTGSGNYVAAQFTTTAPCIAPTGLTSSTTSSSATVGWSAVGGANNYDVDYSLAGQNAWVSAATATTNLSVNITSLSPSTNYDWRVRANCASGPSGYSIAQFTTLAPAPCNAPSGLGSSAITSSGATVSWGSVSGANNYDVDYSVAGQNSWTNVVTATTNLSANITGLSPSTNYDWRVRANCASGPSGYSIAQFTTTAVVTCPDQFEPNNSISTPAIIPVNTNINAQIASSTDNDYYAFNNSSSQKNIKVTLTNLPADYDMKLYGKNNILLGTSTNTGTTPETIVYNNSSKATTYKVFVYGKTSNDWSNTNCYTLNVTIGSGPLTATSGVGVINDESNISLVRGGLKLYPIPASTAVTISFDAYAKGTSDIVIVNQLGQQVLFKKVLVSDGINFNTIDVSALKNGVYTLKVNNGKEIQTKKMIINK